MATVATNSHELMSATGEVASPPVRTEPRIPVLENGDRLTRPEFERRFDAMPHLKKAELIDGVVYMASPVSFDGHGVPHIPVIGWIDRYIEVTPGVEAAADASVRLDLPNMPQPDVLLRITTEAGGNTTVSEDDYLEGAPELVVEVASSSASYDLHAKLAIYRRNGVREYVVWRTQDHAVDWFILRDGEYFRVPVGPGGVYRSEVFPGLWLDPEALIRGDRGAMTRALNQGTASPEHAAFVASLQAAIAPPKPTEA
jgi:Uma2 family endonuclease